MTFWFMKVVLLAFGATQGPAAYSTGVCASDGSETSQAHRDRHLHENNTAPAPACDSRLTEREIQWDRLVITRR